MSIKSERPPPFESPASSSAAPPRLIIEPRGSLFNWKELWRFRDLLIILAARDVKIRYRQAMVGIGWAVIQPVATVLVFGVFFGLIGHAPVVGDTPYLLSVFCGLLLWQLFSNSLTQASGSLVANRHVITKVYFPRMLLPTASVLCALVDSAIAFVVLLGLMVWYGWPPTPAIMLAPLWVLLVGLTAIGAGLWFSALCAIYRDFSHVVPFLLQVGFWASPVVYESRALIPARWRLLYELNPLVGALEGFRWSVLGGPPPPARAIGLCLLAIGLLLVSGMVYFRRTEHVLADRI